MTAQPSNTNHPNVYFKWILFSLTFGSSQISYEIKRLLRNRDMIDPGEGDKGDNDP